MVVYGGLWWWGGVFQESDMTVTVSVSFGINSVRSHEERSLSAVHVSLANPDEHPCNAVVLHTQESVLLN